MQWFDVDKAGLAKLVARLTRLALDEPALFQCEEVPA